MKELEKISNLCFWSKMSFHKVIFTPITTAQRNLHFMAYMFIFEPLEVPIFRFPKFPKKNIPKTLLLQLDFFEHHPEHINFFTFTL